MVQRHNEPRPMAGILAAAGLMFGLVTPAPAAAEPEAITVLRNAAEKFCADGGGEVRAWARSLNAQVVKKKAFERGINLMGWRGALRFPGGDEIRYRSFERKGRMWRLNLEYYARHGGDTLRPVLSTTVGGRCRIGGGRGIRYDSQGRPDRLEHYDLNFLRIARSEPLNPPVPPGRDPGGVTVALFDAGLNYTLPQFAERLARRPDGKALGFDYWDMDDRPFDGNPARSPFAPQRHGTEIASVLLREAPEVRLLPYRYPRPDMKRMADMVKAADNNGAVIVSMPMGSNRKDDWWAFLSTANAHPHMLFVISAGNNGRDIGQRPVYPAAFGLENAIVVTSADDSGWLARGSNWGKARVDLMIPAENLWVTRFDGSAGRGSGSSHAVARVAALAARLLKRNPDWRAPDLKAAILERATPAIQPSVSRYGWLPLPPPKADSK